MIQGLLVNIIILVIAIIVLDKASHWAIVNSIRIADITGFGRTTVGFILVSLSTSLPELSVALFSTTDEQSVGIAIGNVLGSNIVNICFVLGVSILFASWKQLSCIDFLPFITRDEIKRLQLGLFAASVIPLSLIYIGYASRLIGFVLIVIFIWNTYNFSKSDLDFRDEGAIGEEREKLPYYVGLSVIGAIGVVVCSYFIVQSATTIALGLGIPRVVIGATIVAFGTSIPELATSIEATKNESLNLALGNIVGSGFLNITLILGISLISTKFVINIGAFTNVAIFSLIGNLFLWYSLSGERICWREGVVLLFLYMVFLFTSFRQYPIL
jgi:cation:H+ antiporter